MGRYEQLNPATLSLSKAAPAVISALIEGITSRLQMLSPISRASSPVTMSRSCQYDT